MREDPHEDSSSHARPPMRFLPAAALSCVLALSVAAAPAGAGERLRLSGFGTLGHAADSRDDMAPMRDITQKPRQGFRTGSSWRLDSRFGLQLEFAATRDIDLVGQVVLRDHFDSDFDSSVELAYAAFRPHARWDLRAGRINYDAFLMSDHRNVGYAYAWVRPPQEFYGWIPIHSLDGVDAAVSLPDGDARWRLKAQAGQSRLSIPIGEGYEFRADRLLGLSLTRDSGAWRAKLAHSRFTIGSEVPALAPLQAGLAGVAGAGIPGVSGEAARLHRHAGFDSARISYTTLGASHDDGLWWLQGELGVSTSTRDMVPHGRMAYLSVGRRIGDWMPYVLLSASYPGNDLRKARQSWGGGLDAGLRDPALHNINTTRMAQKTLSLGVRWEVHRQAAIKLQLDHTRVEASGYGLWWRDMALNGRDSRINMLSATLDFVF